MSLLYLEIFMGRWISAKLSNSLMNIKVNIQWKII